ncbi:MAG TPA: hypothetical protein DEO56_04840 [Nitrosomonas nitrosa]|nr:hypothetical protein [Nitrosomonas nitrosa]HNP52529.1 hypothetical protein [Nitrosomonas nitrosa]
MTTEETPKSYIEVVDQAYPNAVFEALMNYQALEVLLKSCIFKCYEILNSTSHKVVTYNPSREHLKSICKKSGLGGLADTFKVVTPHKDICDRIKNVSEVRNLIAHRAAVDYLKMQISNEVAREWHSKAVDFNEAAAQANNLYLELIEIYQEILDAHGKL